MSPANRRNMLLILEKDGYLISRTRARAVCLRKDTGFMSIRF